MNCYAHKLNPPSISQPGSDSFPYSLLHFHFPRTIVFILAGNFNQLGYKRNKFVHPLKIGVIDEPVAFIQIIPPNGFNSNFNDRDNTKSKKSCQVKFLIFFTNFVGGAVGDCLTKLKKITPGHRFGYYELFTTVRQGCLTYQKNKCPIN